MTAVAAARGADSQLRATLIGAIAILLWSSLALLTTLTVPVPPFQLVAMTFAVGGLAGLAFLLATGGRVRERLAAPAIVWAIGIGGLFGYHLLYFIGLATIAPVEANLLNYLWPLLIVLLTGLLPGEHLRWWHLAGATSGLLGALIIVTRGFSTVLGDGPSAGYAAALGAAVVWAAYSVLSRRYPAVSSDAIGGFCIATAILALCCHLLLETTVWPASWTGWLAILLLGCGPVGAAFFCWDHGVKQGNIKALSGLSYAIPLLSTVSLIAAGRASASPGLVVACLAIVGGAVLATRELWDGQDAEGGGREG